MKKVKGSVLKYTFDSIYYHFLNVVISITAPPNCTFRYASQSLHSPAAATDFRLFIHTPPIPSSPLLLLLRLCTTIIDWLMVNREEEERIL